MAHPSKTFFISLASILVSANIHAQNPASQCLGTPAAGLLKNGWQLPASGKNFTAYSNLGVAMGRNYVHSKVHALLLAAYQDLETSAAGKLFTYGETGFARGGKFKPHKTHQNGLSVDFFVPLLDAKDRSVAFPASPLNKLGYNIEFDQRGHYEELRIDFAAMAQHLIAIKKAADTAGVGIRMVIFDNQLQQLLFADPTGKKLVGLLPFSVKKPWVRHDEHYHIDFVIPCKKL
jgi:penicillin-insensitive murein DD-endopeptidase